MSETSLFCSSQPLSASFYHHGLSLTILSNRRRGLPTSFNSARSTPFNCPLQSSFPIPLSPLLTAPCTPHPFGLSASSWPLVNDPLPTDAGAYLFLSSRIGSMKHSFQFPPAILFPLSPVPPADCPLHASPPRFFYIYTLTGVLLSLFEKPVSARIMRKKWPLALDRVLSVQYDKLV